MEPVGPSWAWLFLEWLLVEALNAESLLLSSGWPRGCRPGACRAELPEACGREHPLGGLLCGGARGVLPCRGGGGGPFLWGFSLAFWSCLGLCRVWNSIPGPHPLDARSHRCPQTWSSVPWGQDCPGETPVWEHLLFEAWFPVCPCHSLPWVRTCVPGLFGRLYSWL